MALQVTADITRPALRYHGGKFRVAPWVLSLMPPHGSYIEPYGGGGSILLRKPRVRNEVYNDLDQRVVNFFRVLRDPASAAELQRRVSLTPYARAEFEWSYEPPVDRIDDAHKLVVKAFQGHGSDSATRPVRTGFRARASAERCTPAVEWASWPEQIPAFTRRLQGVLVENAPAIDVIQRQDQPGALHYVDPPYVHSTRSSRQGRGGMGYAHEMKDADHRQLAEVLHGCRGMVMLSGYRSALYDELYGDWRRYEHKAAADMGKQRTECMWLNAAAQAGTIQMGLL